LVLLQNGADPNLRTNDKPLDEKIQNKTASEIAKIKRHTKIASLIGIDQIIF